MINRETLRRGSAFKLLALGALVLAALFGYLKMNAAAAAMQTASQDVAACRTLVAEITELQDLPQFAALEADRPQTIRESVEQATKTARLPAASLIRIQPQPPFRLGNSEYRLWPTRLELNAVTLQQVTSFAHALADEQRGLTVRDLRLWTPTSESTAGSGETWSAEITLTQVTFSPKSR